MKNTLSISTLVLIFASVLMTSCGSNKKPAEPVVAAPTHEQIVQRGQYLVTTMGCSDCHSPKKMGQQGPEVIPETNLSGYPANLPLMKVNKEALKAGWMLMNMDITESVGPWGASFSANITSDQTGIGNWPEENFRRALKEGWFKGLEGTRKLLPPMPWENLGSLTDDDIKAVFEYLMSTKPVNNAVPDALSPEELK
jgi:mono/diheme cytochrome c family protein